MNSLTVVFVAVSVLSFLHGAMTAKSSVPIDSFKWSRTLESGTTVQQKGFSIDSGSRIFIGSYDPWLYKDGLVPSKTVIDFNNAPDLVTVVKIGKACYLVDTDPALNSTLVVNELENRNGNTLTDPPMEVFVSAVEDGSKLNSTAKAALFATNPALKKICNPYYTPIFQTTLLGAKPTPGECEKLVCTVTYDDVLSVLIKKSRGYNCH